MAHINATCDVKVLKHLKEMKALVLNIPDHKVGELKKLKGIKYVEEDKMAKAFGFGDYADVRWNVNDDKCAPRVGSVLCYNRRRSIWLRGDCGCVG